MAYETTFGSSFSQTVRDNWGWFLALGIILVLGGLLALAMPLAAGLAATIYVGAALLVGGVVQLIHAFRMRSWSGFLMDAVLAVVMILGGVAIWVQPGVGLLTLTLLLAIVFVVKGIAQIALAFRIRPLDGWGWILAAGIISALVGLMILIQFPFSGLYAPGVLAGISLLFTGWSYIAIAWACRTRSSPGTPARA